MDAQHIKREQLKQMEMKIRRVEKKNSHIYMYKTKSGGGGDGGDKPKNGIPSIGIEKYI